MRTLILVVSLTLAGGSVAPVAAQGPPARLRITPAAIASVSFAPGRVNPPARSATQATAEGRPAAARSWLQRNWKWLLPVVAGGAAAGITLAVRGGETTTTTPASGG